MNKENVTFKSQYILQLLAKINPEFTYNNISIDVMKSQVCNEENFFYIVPIVLNDVGKTNVVCEGFVISETHFMIIFI